MTDPVGLDWVLLSNYLAGEASADDAAALERWIGDDAERAALVQRFQQIWDQRARTSASLFDRAAVESHILSKIAVPPTPATPFASRRRAVGGPSLASPPKSVMFRSWVVQVAPAIGLAVALVGVLTWGVSSPAARRLWQNHGRIVTRTYATHRAQQASISLPDGSSAVLAPETELRYQADANGTRTVDLRGAASFVVAHDGAHPFVVQSGRVRTRVLGTTFLVQHYRDDRAVRVSVQSGKVLVTAMDRTRDAGLTLTAGTVGVVTDSTATAVSVDSIRPYTSWTSQHLLFRGVPMPDVLVTLTRWYGVQFQLADSSLAEHTLTAVLDATSLPNALNTIKPIMHVEFTFNGNVVTLHTRRAIPAEIRNHPQDGLTKPQTEVGR